jgi:hypothetical protein
VSAAERQPDRDRATWWSAVVSLAVLTVITAIISYEHAYEVFRAAHNVGALAILGPVVPDLVIAVSSISLLAASRADIKRPTLAVAALTVFVVVTMALNVAAGVRYGRGSALLAVLAPAGYLVGLHILAGMMRRGRGGDAASARAGIMRGGGGGDPAPAPATPAPCPHSVAASRDEAIVMTWLHGRDCLGEPPTYRELGRHFDVHHDTARRAVLAWQETVAPAVPEPSPNGQAVAS